MNRRAMMSYLLASVLAMAGFIGVADSHTVKAAAQAKDYASHTAKAAIDFGVQKKYLWLDSKGNFYPNSQITQGQFIASLVAIRGLKEVAPVPQLPAGHWAKMSYEKAQKAGILAGVKVEPNKLLTKEETAALVYAAWKPIRGEKDPNLSNAGALITWGWMKLAPSGQPKFREDLPVTRGEAAEILRYLWKDKWQLEEGAKYAAEFHKSLKIVNGKIVGKVPRGDSNFKMEAMFFTKQNEVKGFLKNQSFNVPVGNVIAFSFSVINSNDSTDAGIFMYKKLPTLEQTNNTRKFHTMKGEK
ncbi:S-layer homology domain-containing protein [Brevibacillus porteri]|uniref:SLH domain-containing protein n=1 Tax=Brevibacillus porteri TaxID=2126350 RepID=A0ABX5FT63_9BACL|nr:S-layer homology domain-containing protein [Brevibacillus porteri]MED1800329.1 S-layer homology domain-containing protein [Brevibacillus porteri]MED2134089.1 S-layer homology domain-containing protein [Brevibacillus porteri]MED2745785.1 S-layer homology domain-containing protein [Brevibacillus porteri]MED2813033.1 S-layer homology domain-containing protein [Brevibacillus porteri]MED2893273.1 S-layer homology domain-containing protein [Brevibacillus porteri]